MQPVLYELQGPTFATHVGDSFGLKGIRPGLCGCKTMAQLKPLSVELMFEPHRHVWLPEGGEILVTAEVIKKLEEKKPQGMVVEPAQANWYNHEEVDYDRPAPLLVQIRANQLVNTDPCCLKFTLCPMHSAGIVEPLVVFTPHNMPEYAVYRVDETPGRIVMTKAVRDLLLSFDNDLDFTEIKSS